MSYTVKMQDTQTGETLTFQMRPTIKWEEGSEFWWSEGNYGCDCNRFLEFEEARTGKRPSWDEATCGDGRYKVLSITLPGGEEVYKDD